MVRMTNVVKRTTPSSLTNEELLETFAEDLVPDSAHQHQERPTAGDKLAAAAKSGGGAAPLRATTGHITTLAAAAASAPGPKGPPEADASFPSAGSRPLVPQLNLPAAQTWAQGSATGERSLHDSVKSYPSAVASNAGPLSATNDPLSSSSAASSGAQSASAAAAAAAARAFPGLPPLPLPAVAEDSRPGGTAATSTSSSAARLSAATALRTLSLSPVPEDSGPLGRASGVSSSQPADLLSHEPSHSNPANGAGSSSSGLHRDLSLSPITSCSSSAVSSPRYDDASPAASYNLRQGSSPAQGALMAGGGRAALQRKQSGGPGEGAGDMSAVQQNALILQRQLGIIREFKRLMMEQDTRYWAKVSGTATLYACHAKAAKAATVVRDGSMYIFIDNPDFN